MSDQTMQAPTVQGVVTRSQAKLLKEGLHRQVTIAKRKSTTRHSFMSIDDENAGIPAPSGRKSFPLEHNGDPWSKTSKKLAKTDTSAKQKRALCERGRNNYDFRHRPSDPAAGETTCPVSAPGDQGAQAEDCLHQTQDDEVFLASDSSTWDRGDLAIASVIPRSPMDCMSPHPPLLRDPPLPPYIPDIDANPDGLDTSIYSKTIMEYLYNMEGEFVLKHDFLDKSPEVTSRMRGLLVDWLLQVQNHEDLKEETLHLCVSFIDQFLSEREVLMPKLQLLGISCMLIASKFCERFAPEIEVLCYLTADTFQKQEVIVFERLVLQVLQFLLGRPTCVYFLERFLQVHRLPKEVSVLSSYLLDLSITQVSLVPVLPSLKAAAALYLARLLLMHPVGGPPWTPELAYYTNYTHDDFRDIVSELATLLIKVPDSKFQGARSKYNSKEFLFISAREEVSPEWVLLRQFGKVIKP